MNLFEGLQSVSDIADRLEEKQAASQMDTMYPDLSTLQEEYNNFQTQPMLYPNMATITCSPYVEDNWGNAAGILSTFNEEITFPQRDDKIDPNKIYTSDIAALRSLAADHIRLKKIFEKRLSESLRDKDKFGLNENDILGMQALNQATSTITAINKEQIQIKKNIADIRLKQQQNRAQANNNGQSTNGENGQYVNSSMIGRQIMDDIFNMPTSPVDMPEYNAPQMDIDQAASILDSVVPVSENVQYETMHPTTYAVIDELGNPVGFETYDDTGNLIPSYPNPTSNIIDIDRDSMVAEDDLKRKFPVKYYNEHL